VLESLIHRPNPHIKIKMTKESEIQQLAVNPEGSRRAEPQKIDFPETAPAAPAVFFRTYSRRRDTVRETWLNVCDRALSGLKKLGQLTEDEAKLIQKMMHQLKSLPSGRWLWVGGVEWLEQQENFSGAYNCTSTNVVDWRSFGLMMDLAMMGCGTGAVIETHYIEQLPPIRNHLNVRLEGTIGSTPKAQRREQTEVKIEGNRVYLYVGDSRNGWVKSYETLLELSTDQQFDGEVEVIVNLADIRPEGEVLKGFGGVANPVKLPSLYQRCANILNKAVGRQLNSVECCLLIDEAAVTIVSGNIRRCLPVGSLVHTESGLVPIEKVRIGDRVLTSSGFYPVTNFFYQGPQSLCRITTEEGTLECTPHHKIAVLQEGDDGHYKMVKAKDLKPGHRLVFVPRSIPGTATELPEFEGKDISIPALTTDVAYFLGYWQANSSHSKLPLRVREEKIGHRLLKVAAEFGVEEYIGQCVEECIEDNTILEFHNSSLLKYLAQFDRKSVPDCILLGTVAIRQAYLAGWKDGCSLPLPSVNVDIHLQHQIRVLQASLGVTMSPREELVKLGGKVEKAEINLSVTGNYWKTNNQHFGYPSTTLRLRPGQALRASAQCRQQTTNNQQQTTNNKQPTLRLPFDCAQGKRSVQATNNQNLIPLVVKSVEMDVRTAPTYDLEVATIHEFVCEGILVSNSAGMRQGGSDDGLFAGAKENLWQQGEDGNWRIDPERDALRMANHTRVFHHKPTLEECIAAVRKQYYSGEGAIQWAGEAIARANADLSHSENERLNFLKALAEGKGADWIKQQVPGIEKEELDHRLKRYGLNPCGEIIGSNFHCVAGDTLLITRDGIHSIASLAGQTVEIWNGQRWSPVIPMLTGTNRKLYRVSFSDGTFLDVTEKHRFFVKDRFAKAYLEMTAGSLLQRLANCKYSLHTEPFKIDYRDGQFIDPTWAYTLGQLVGDGSVCQSNGKPQLQLRLYGAKSYQELAIAGETSGKRPYYAENPNSPCLLYTGFQDRFDANYVRDLKQDARLLEDFGEWSRESILHFVAGWIDADGSATKSGGVRLYISSYDRAYRIYLLLLKCGIRSSINLFAPAGQATNLGIRQKDLWYLQITDCAAIPCQRVDTSGGHEPQSKGKWQIIRSVEPLEGQHHTFCFNELEFHKGVFGGTLTGQCNLGEIHLNQIDPNNVQEQEEAFTAAALSVATLLNHKFMEERYHYSRQIDPIVGVSFTGLFDFCVHAFGTDWLRWWAEGRPNSPEGKDFKQQEATYLNRWRETVERVVWDYCDREAICSAARAAPRSDRHQLNRPNRCTTIQPAGTKSLLTGASPGWHPPKAQRFIRRITFRKNDPVALACLDYGYNIVPSQSDKDERGNLLNDPFDPRCTEWLVEIPTEVSWANLPGADAIDISQFSALAQMDFYMNVQRHYTRHNCFVRSTEFLTNKGVRTFEDFKEGDKVVVLNGDGNWVESTVVKTSEPRSLVQIKVKEGRTGKEKIIVSTSCHRFPVRRSSAGASPIKIKAVSELKIGNRFVLNSAELPDIDLEGEWRIVEIDHLEEKQYCWCVMEPKTQRFTLSENILTCNTSATIELREHEIEDLGTRIYEAIRDDEGYISAALLARFDDHQTFPRLPFEPIDKETYDKLVEEVKLRQKTDDFYSALSSYDSSSGYWLEAGPAGCDSDKCLLPEDKPQ